MPLDGLIEADLICQRTRSSLFVVRVFIALALLIGGASAQAASTDVNGIRLATDKGQTRIALDLSQRAEHRIFTLANPHRVVIDIKPARIRNSALPLPTGKGHIRRIRSANRKDGSLRVVLDLNRAAKPRSFLLAPNGKQGNRLVVDLVSVGEPGPSGSSPTNTAPVTTANQPGPRNSQARVAGPSNRPANIGSGSRLPTQGLQTKGRPIVIAIDPGHGGKDPGAAGPTGVREKDVVLNIARELAAAIDAEPTMRAYLTRRDDRFVKLRQRLELSRSASADLFVSIHADAFHDRSVHGATVYVLSSKGASDEFSRRLAERENSQTQIGGVRLDDKDQTLASVLIDLSQNASLSASIDIGTEILHEIGQVTKIRKKRVQQAPFLVLKSPDVPSILIETAFISNPRDEKNLVNRAYRQRLTAAMFAGIQDYFEANPPDGTYMAQLQRERKRFRTVQHLIRPGETLSGIADRYHVPMRRIRSVNRLQNDRIFVGRVLQIPATHEI